MKIDLLVTVLNTHEVEVLLIPKVELLVEFVGLYCAPNDPTVSSYFSDNVDNNANIVAQVHQDYAELLSLGNTLWAGAYDLRVFLKHIEVKQTNG